MTACLATDCGATTDGVLCRPCGQELRRALQNHRPGDPDIPTLMAAVSQAATGSARVYRANRRPGQPDQELSELEAEIGARHLLTPANLRSKDGRVTLPATNGVVNLAARDLLDKAWNALTTTMRDFCERNHIDLNAELDRMPGPDRIGPRQIADWLADRVNSIRYDQAGPEIHHELTRLRERLIRAVDRGPSRVYAGPCEAPVENGGRCARPLYASFNPFRMRYEDDEFQPPETDGPVIICDGFRPASDKAYDPSDRGCGAEHSAQDRRDWLIADLSDRLETLAFWTYWWPFLVPRLSWPARSTWWKWTHPSRPGAAPRLQAKSLTRDAEELYRGGDLLDLVAREQPRIRGNTVGYARRNARSA